MSTVYCLIRLFHDCFIRLYSRLDLTTSARLAYVRGCPCVSGSAAPAGGSVCTCLPEKAWETQMALAVQEFTGTGAAVAARLCNFATGSTTPLPDHDRWLDAKLRPLVASNPSAWVDLIGHASRQWRHTGAFNAHQLNRALSFQRCEALKRRIGTFGSGVHFNLELAEGDSQSLTPNPDDGYDRAVEVLVYAAGPPPKPPKPPAVQSLNFEIRVVGGGSASALIQADNYFFQIVDLTRRKTAFYLYTGVGLGISIPKISRISRPGSVTKSGPPTAFRTTRDAQLYMFNSQASLYQDPGATIGPLSVGGTLRLTIKEIFDSSGVIFTHPPTIPISGGSGVQMPGLWSASEGVLALASDIFPFTGY